MGKNGGRQTLSKEMLEAIAEKAAEIAAAVATNTYQQKVKEEEKAKLDKRYKNTKLLSGTLSGFLRLWGEGDI